MGRFTVFLAIFAFCISTYASGSQTRFILGESKILSADEKVLYGTNVVLAKREYKLGLNEIWECALVIDSSRGTDVYNTSAKVTGSDFALSDEKGTYSGNGKLFGSPWNWSAWEFNVTLTDGSGTIYAFETFDPAGMTSYKTFKGPNGNIQVVMREAFQDISEATYKLLFKQLVPQGLSCK
ncbi:MAG: hypothetical protein KDD25_08975 [Bdellovibrionales bacterium]|nr:hypothetical protein [Bdellovibrionales bacterium]